MHFQLKLRGHFCNCTKDPLTSSLRFLMLRTLLCVITGKSNHSEGTFSWFPSVLPRICVVYDVMKPKPFRVRFFFIFTLIICRFKTRTSGPVNPVRYCMRRKNVLCQTKVIKRTERCPKIK